MDNLELLKRYEASPTPANRNRVVEANLKLVLKAAHRLHKNSEIPFDDLYSVGCLGLIRAVERFDLKSGNQFSSFAMPYIRGAMLHHRRDKESPGGLKIPRGWVDNRTKILAGDFSKVKPEDQDMALQALQYRAPASLDQRPDNDDDDVPAIQLVAPNQTGTLPPTLEDVLMSLGTPVDENLYFDATAICKRYNRRFAEWRRLPSTIRLIESFESSLVVVGESHHKRAIFTRRGRGAGSWLHRDLSAAFLQWVSAETALAVTKVYSAAVDNVAS